MLPKQFSAWSFLGLVTVVFAASTILGGMVAFLVSGGALIGGDGSVEGPAMFVAYVLQFSLAVGAGLWLLGRMGGAKPDLRAGWRDVPVAVWGVVLLTAAGVAIEPLLGLFPDHYLKGLDDMIGKGGWMAVLTVAAAPVLEELLFRGVVLEGLARRWSAARAVAASALLFGAAHLPNLPQAVNAFVMAGVMGYIYILSGRRLVPVILVHAANNAVAYATLRLTGTQTVDTRELVGSDTLYWTLHAAATVVFIASMVVMVRRARNKTYGNSF